MTTKLAAETLLPVLKKNSHLFMPVAVIGCIAVTIIPVPPLLLNILEPVSFSVFPSLLLFLTSSACHSVLLHVVPPFTVTTGSQRPALVIL
jgi:hypothetical protein